MNTQGEASSETPATGRGRLRIGPWNISSVEVVLFLVAGGMGVAADKLSLPFLSDPAVVLLGLVLILLGADQIIARIPVYAGSWAYGRFAGMYKVAIEQLWGLIFAGIGLMLIAKTMLKWLAPGTAESTWNGLVSSTAAIGLSLGAVGLMTTLHGLIRMLAGSHGDGRATGFTGFLDRVAGALTLAFGAGLALIGFVVLWAPHLINDLVAQLGALIAGP